MRTIIDSFTPLVQAGKIAGIGGADELHGGVQLDLEGTVIISFRPGDGDTVLTEAMPPMTIEEFVAYIERQIEELADEPESE